MSLTGYFPMYSAGPSDLMLNYADAGEKSKLTAPHTEMWLAGVYNNNHFSDFLIERLQTRTANVRNVIWYRPYSNISMHRDLDKFFGGKVALFFSRSSWTDANALWVGIKAGYNKVNHAHLDLGNFELDALGQRWVRDLGSDDYNLPGYFSGSTQTSQRWTYYRINSFSHNVPVLNGKNQDISATSQIVKHAVGVAEPFTIIDFTEAYKEFATSALRGLKVVNERKAVLIQDEFEIAKASSISWGITTDATILIVKDKEAELTLNGKKLIVKILSPANAVFSSESAQQAAPQKANTGVSRLLAKMPEQTGNITITILLEPQWTGGLSGYSSAMVSLSNW
ncbi:MAG: hypothetical protein HC905_13960 [Bacteroidales bacterium]|nr:hypothetical protein [Bacteroidales bacterium]